MEIFALIGGERVRQFVLHVPTLVGGSPVARALGVGVAPRYGGQCVADVYIIRTSGLYRLCVDRLDKQLK